MPYGINREYEVEPETAGDARIAEVVETLERLAQGYDAAVVLCAGDERASYMQGKAAGIRLAIAELER